MTNIPLVGRKDRLRDPDHCLESAYHCRGLHRVTTFRMCFFVTILHAYHKTLTDMIVAKKCTYSCILYLYDVDNNVRFAWPHGNGGSIGGLGRRP